MERYLHVLNAFTLLLQCTDKLQGKEHEIIPSTATDQQISPPVNFHTDNKTFSITLSLYKK